MAFPDLVFVPGGVLHSEATGTPTDGDNTFALGIAAADVVEDWLTIIVIARDEFVTNCSYVGLSGDKSQLTLNFEQTGSGDCTVIARIEHTGGR